MALNIPRDGKKGVTTTVAKHQHTYEVDEMGNGVARKACAPNNPDVCHSHAIINGEVQSAHSELVGPHIHSLPGITKDIAAVQKAIEETAPPAPLPTKDLRQRIANVVLEVVNKLGQAPNPEYVTSNPIEGGSKSTKHPAANSPTEDSGGTTLTPPAQTGGGTSGTGPAPPATGMSPTGGTTGLSSNY